MIKCNFKTIIGLLLSIIAIVFIVNYVNFNQVWFNLKKLNTKTIVFALIVYLVSIMLRSYRWRYIIKQRFNIPFPIILKTTIYGYMLNQLLPAKLGELGRAEYLANRFKKGRIFFLGTIIAERIFDIFIVLLFLISSVMLSETILNLFSANYIPVVVILFVTVSGIYVLYNIAILKNLTNYLPEILKEFINRIINNIEKAFGLFGAPKQIIYLSGLTFIIWCFTCLIYYLILTDLEISIPYYAYFFVVSAGTFGMVIPSTSANVGVYHAVAMGALMVFMVEKDQALSFAIIAHAFDFSPV